jgi:hypothetical protein
LAADGVLHKITVAPLPGRRGRRQVWRPTTVPSNSTEDDLRRLEADIRSGRMTGRLPTISNAARQHRVHTTAMSALYNRLQQDGVIDLVWMPDLSRRAWHVLDRSADGDPQYAGVDCRALVITHDLVRRIPEWLVRRPRDRWARTLLPDIETLREEYRTHFSNAELALELLVLLDIVERQIVSSQRRYLPRPPVDGGTTFDLKFQTVSGYIGRDWFAVADTKRWRTPPTSKNDPLVALARTEGRRRRLFGPRPNEGGKGRR